MRIGGVFGIFGVFAASYFIILRIGGIFGVLGFFAALYFVVLRVDGFFGGFAALYLVVLQVGGIFGVSGVFAASYFIILRIGGVLGVFGVFAASYFVVLRVDGIFGVFGVAREPLPLPGDLQYLWMDTRKIIDSLYIIIQNHQDTRCQQRYDPMPVKEENPKFNTMSCEQTFAWLARYKIVVSMGKCHHHFYLRRNRYIAFSVMQTIGGLFSLK